MFDSHKSREHAENHFGFGEQDVEFFGAKLQTRSDRDLAEKPSMPGEEEEGEKQFVQKTEYNQEELEGIDMHNLNLFGIPLEEALGKEGLKDVAGTSAETQKVLRELIELTDEISGSSIANFGMRKSFVYYDPYEPDESVTYSYLKFEDKL